MLEKYFLRLATVDRIRASWVGPVIEKYVAWLDENRYAARVVFARVPTVVHFGNFAQGRGAKSWEELPHHVDAFVKQGLTFMKRKRTTKSSMQRLRGDLRLPVEQMLRLVLPGYKGLGRARRTARPFSEQLPGFFSYLVSERGVCHNTTLNYDCHITALEKHLIRRRIKLTQLTPSDLVAYVAARAKEGLTAAGMRGACACLRVFLRYAQRQGVFARDLSLALDTPLIYRLATVPTSLKSSEVQVLISSIDRRDASGKRDYALLLLLLTYGLRVKEAATIKLDDIDWKHDRLLVRLRKVGNSTGYPLTPAVGEALIEYIRNGRPTTDSRHLFMSSFAPLRAMSPAAITDRMRTLLKRGGIAVPKPGGRIFRRTCIQRLVDAEVPYKTISDYVGHRSTLSQGTYAKVAIEALRDVAVGAEAIL